MPLIVMQAATWLWANKKIVLSVALAVFLFLYGWHHGAAHVQAEWDASAARERELTQAAIDAEHIKAEKIASDFTDFRQKSQAIMFNLRKELSHEISITPALHDCVATAGFLRLYEAAGSGSESSDIGQ